MILWWWGNKLHVFKIVVWGFGMRVFPNGGEFLAVGLFPERLFYASLLWNIFHYCRLIIQTLDIFAFQLTDKLESYGTDFCFLVFWFLSMFAFSQFSKMNKSPRYNIRFFLYFSSFLDASNIFLHVSFQ